jgi:uncharacterized protein YdhG (YjbR/CyaY superfamily)
VADEEMHRFLESIPSDKRPLFERLQSLIEGLYPDATLVLSYGVPTYKVKTGWIALGYWKDGVSVYTNGRHNIEAFRSAYPAVKTGTGTINFRLTDEIPVESLTRVIHLAMGQKGTQPQG